MGQEEENEPVQEAVLRPVPPAVINNVGSFDCWLAYDRPSARGWYADGNWWHLETPEEFRRDSGKYTSE
jgi:hypothetical protein